MLKKKISEGEGIKELERFLNILTPGYQKITLPTGSSIGGRSREHTANIIFERDTKGKTVLDVGCDIGYFCFEALRRGAKKAVGIDIDPYRIDVAKSLAKLFGLPAEFRVLNIEEDNLKEKFDIVLCLNLLHHLKNPISVLDKLIGLTREVLVLEVAGINKRDMVKMGMGKLSTLQKYPAMVVGKSGTSGKYVNQKFFISKQAMINLLVHHRNIFSRVDMLDSEFKERYIAMCHKRRVENLVVVAGPTSSGKTTLIKRLLNGREPEIAKKIGIAGGSKSMVLDADQLLQSKEDYIENLILHYDILRPWGKGYESDEALDLLDSASKVIVLTLFASPPVLLVRLVKGEFGGVPPSVSRELRKSKRAHAGYLPSFLRSYLKDQITSETAMGKLLKKFKGTSVSRRHLKVHQLYNEPTFVYKFYDRWFSFCNEKIRGKFWTLDASKRPYKIYKGNEWRTRPNIRSPLNSQQE